MRKTRPPVSPHKNEILVTFSHIYHIFIPLILSTRFIKFENTSCIAVTLLCNRTFARRGHVRPKLLVNLWHQIEQYPRNSCTDRDISRYQNCYFTLTINYAVLSYLRSNPPLPLHSPEHLHNDHQAPFHIYH